MSQSISLRTGIWEHYKHRLYRLEGIATYGGNPTEFDWEAMSIKGVAHYSEDPRVLLMVAALEGMEPILGATGLYYFRIGAQSAPQPTPQKTMVYYTALHTAAEGDHWTPRQCLRPYDGPEGWTTPKDLGGLKLERFVHVPDLTAYLKRAERDGTRHDFRGGSQCMRCGEYRS